MYRRVIFVLLNVFAIFITNGGGEFCFRQVSSGNKKKCNDVIPSVGTKEECCEAGGSGWAPERNGKRCEPACPVKFCFRKRRATASGRLGSCSNLIGSETREDCCRRGGQGWSKHRTGQRCVDTCLGVADANPVQFCFSSRNQNSERCRASSLLGEKTKSECCQNGGNGWSANRNGLSCENPCETGLHEAIQGGWSDWSEWNACSKTCGHGIQLRFRTCDNPAPKNGGADCVGNQVEEAACRDSICPINGTWGEWQPYGKCSATCHDGNIVYRQQIRECNNPPPQFGGLPCVGPSILNTACTDLPHCPVHGGWSEFGGWSRCSQTCDNGTQIRTRTCDEPIAQYGGLQCEGEDTEERICLNSVVCPTHGGWSEWGDWIPCNSRSCGMFGSTFRYRSCTNPTPKDRGFYCFGRSVDQKMCTRCEDSGSGSGSGSGELPWLIVENDVKSKQGSAKFSYSFGEFINVIEDLQPSLLDQLNEAEQLDIDSDSFSLDYSLEEHFFEESNQDILHQESEGDQRQRVLIAANGGSDSYSFDDI